MIEIAWPSETRTLGRELVLDLEAPFRCQNGGTLEEIRVAYESWGTLDGAGTNAVLVVHPLATDCHVTGEAFGQPPGWWEPLVGPGRAIDTDRFFVVCPNLLGGCYGTTGPRHRALDGAPFLDRFPLVTPRDLMRVTKRFLAALGIARVSMVIGPSMGGMVAWEWALDDLSDAPSAESVVAVAVAIVAAPPWASPLAIGWNWIQRAAIDIDADPASSQPKAGKGFIAARALGMLGYRSPEGLIEKFGRTFFTPPGETLATPGLFNVESWLRHHGKRLGKRFDPWTYRAYSRAMDLHDVRVPEGDEVFARARARVLCVGIRSDQLYPAPEVHAGAERLVNAGRDALYREIDSENGHDAFLLDTDAIASFLSGFDGPGD